MIEELGSVVKRPWLAWLHLLEPHAPYETWPEHDFGRSVIDAYDSEIAKCDAEIGRTLAKLRSMGEAANTVVVVFADHGEEFDERGGRYHNTSLYEEQVRVPLLVAVPGLEGRRLDAPVSLADLVPTLLQLVGVPDPHRRHGRSLWPLLVGRTSETSRPVYMEHFGIDAGRHVRDQRAVVDGNLKLIQRPQQDLYEMYDLAADPKERRNLVGAHPEEARLAGLLLALARIAEGRPEAESAPSSRVADGGGPWRAEFARRLDELLSPDAAATAAAARRLDEMLFDSLSALLPDAKAALGPRGLTEAVDAVVSKARAASRPHQRVYTARTLGRLGDRRAIPALKEMLAAADEARLEVSCALAALGDAAGVEGLRTALTSGLPIAIDAYEAAIGLARLGDKSATPWVTTCLTSPRMPIALGMIGAAPALRDPEIVRFAADVYYNRIVRGRPATRALAKSASSMADDPEGRRLLLMMTQDDDPVVREYATSGAKAAGVSDAELSNMKPRLLAEQEGNNNVRNKAFGPAFARYAEALQGDGPFNPWLRLRFARYLQLEGKVDEARRMLESVVAAESESRAGRVATRRLEAIGKPLRFGRRSSLKAEVLSLTLPPVIAPGQKLLVELRVKNVGADPWPGGLWMHATSLRILWRDKNGSAAPHASPPRTYLPDEGVLPGETLTLQLVVAAPDVRDVEVEAALVIEQLSNAQTPDDGVLAKLPTPVRISPRR